MESRESSLICASERSQIVVPCVKFAYKSINICLAEDPDRKIWHRLPTIALCGQRPEFPFEPLSPHFCQTTPQEAPSPRAPRGPRGIRDVSPQDGVVPMHDASTTILAYLSTQWIMTFEDISSSFHSVALNIEPLKGCPTPTITNTSCGAEYQRKEVLISGAFPAKSLTYSAASPSAAVQAIQKTARLLHITPPQSIPRQRNNLFTVTLNGSGLQNNCPIPDSGSGPQPDNDETMDEYEFQVGKFCCPTHF